MMKSQPKALYLSVPFFLAFLIVLAPNTHADTDVRAVTKPAINRLTPLNADKSSLLTLSPSGCVRTTETLTLSGLAQNATTKWLIKSRSDWLFVETTAIGSKQALLKLPETGLLTGQSYPLYLSEGDNKIDSGLSISICPAFNQLPLLIP